MYKPTMSCPICDQKYLSILPHVNYRNPDKKLGCNHCLWIPQHAYKNEDFLTYFLKTETNNNLSRRIPDFYSLRLDEVPNGLIETNHKKLYKILSDNLHEVDGWWFGTLEERENAYVQLVKFLKPLCNPYFKRTQTL